MAAPSPSTLMAAGGYDAVVMARGASAAAAVPPAPPATVPEWHQRWACVKLISQGAYGRVWYAQCPRTHRWVAIKECLDPILTSADVPWYWIREVTALRTLAPHPHILQLYDLHSHSQPDFPPLLILEAAEITLQDWILARQRQLRDAYVEQRRREPPNRDREPPQLVFGLKMLDVQRILFSLALALYHAHSHGIMHRDVKPSNVLLLRSSPTSSELRMVLADWGMSALLPPARAACLEQSVNVVSLWLRAPEVLLGATNYGAEIDLWSVGCMLIWCLSPRGDFPFQAATEQGVLQKILKWRGGPEEASCVQRWRQLPFGSVYLPKVLPPPVPVDRRWHSLAATFRNPRDPWSGTAVVEILQILDGCCHVEPSQRWSAETLLRHPFLASLGSRGPQRDLSTPACCFCPPPSCDSPRRAESIWPARWRCHLPAPVPAPASTAWERAWSQAAAAWVPTLRTLLRPTEWLALARLSRAMPDRVRQWGLPWDRPVAAPLYLAVHSNRAHAATDTRLRHWTGMRVQACWPTAQGGDGRWPPSLRVLHWDSPVSWKWTRTGPSLPPSLRILGWSDTVHHSLDLDDPEAGRWIPPHLQALQVGRRWTGLWTSVNHPWWERLEALDLGDAFVASIPEPSVLDLQVGLVLPGFFIQNSLRWLRLGHSYTAAWPTRLRFPQLETLIFGDAFQARLPANWATTVPKLRQLIFGAAWNGPFRSPSAPTEPPFAFPPTLRVLHLGAAFTHSLVGPDVVWQASTCLDHLGVPSSYPREQRLPPARTVRWGEPFALASPFQDFP